MRKEQNGIWVAWMLAMILLATPAVVAAGHDRGGSGAEIAVASKVIPQSEPPTTFDLSAFDWSTREAIKPVSSCFTLTCNTNLDCVQVCGDGAICESNRHCFIP